MDVPLRGHLHVTSVWASIQQPCLAPNKLAVSFPKSSLVCVWSFPEVSLGLTQLRSCPWKEVILFHFTPPVAIHCMRSVLLPTLTASPILTIPSLTFCLAALGLWLQACYQHGSRLSRDYLFCRFSGWKDLPLGGGRSEGSHSPEHSYTFTNTSLATILGCTCLLERKINTQHSTTKYLSKCIMLCKSIC